MTYILHSSAHHQTIISNAIATGRCLTFSYHGYTRLVEPHTLGTGSAGQGLMRGYQVGGGSDSGEPVGWKLFRTDEMLGVELATQASKAPRPGYRRGDRAMSRIHAEV